MKKSRLIFLLLILFSTSVYCQKDDRIPVLSDVMDYFSGLENDSLGFIETNWWKNNETAELLAGLRISGYYTEDQTQGTVLNELTGFPVWHEGPVINKAGISVGYTFNPFIIQVNYSEHTFDLDESKLFFALPPGEPNSKDQLSENVKVKDIMIEADYVPLTLFWGYLHITTGIILYSKNYSHGDVTAGYFSAGVQAGAFVKYRNFFAGASISRFLINDEVFNNSDNIKFEGGLWFDLF